MSQLSILYAGLFAEELEWGNVDQLSNILQKYTGGFDIILGADIYILITTYPFLIFKNFQEEENILLLII